MTIDPNAGIDVQFIDNPHAPNVFADAVTGFQLIGDTFRITLECVNADHSDPSRPFSSYSRVVVARLLMPSAAAEAMAKDIISTLANLRENAERVAALHNGSAAVN